MLWVLLYELILRPILKFCPNALLGLMVEFSDWFAQCMRRLEAILKNIHKDSVSFSRIE